MHSRHWALYTTLVRQHLDPLSHAYLQTTHLSEWHLFGRKTLSNIRPNCGPDFSTSLTLKPVTLAQSLLVLWWQDCSYCLGPGLWLQSSFPLHLSGLATAVSKYLQVCFSTSLLSTHCCHHWTNSFYLSTSLAAVLLLCTRYLNIMVSSCYQLSQACLTLVVQGI